MWGFRADSGPEIPQTVPSMIISVCVAHSHEYMYFQFFFLFVSKKIKSPLLSLIFFKHSN